MDEREEELRVGADRVPRRLQRPALVVLVAVAGVLAAWVVTRTGGGGSTPPRTVATSVAAPSSAIVVGPAPSTGRVSDCPPGRTCRTSTGLPGTVLAALRDRYAGARVGSASTLTSTDRGATLLSRTIRAVAGQSRLEITITPFVLGPDTFDRQNIGAVSIVTVKSTGSGATVSVLLTESRSARADDLTVLRLARDPRLTVLR